MLVRNKKREAFLLHHYLFSCVVINSKTYFSFHIFFCGFYELLVGMQAIHRKLHMCLFFHFTIYVMRMQLRHENPEGEKISRNTML